MSTDRVGSLAEEAAGFIAAVQGWAEDAARGRPIDDEHDEEHDEELAHDPVSAACRYCPVCSVARLTEAVTPEVRGHLASAAMSVVLAVRALVDNAPGTHDGSVPVQNVDLAED